VIGGGSGKKKYSRNFAFLLLGIDIISSCFPGQPAGFVYDYIVVIIYSNAHRQHKNLNT
jgi:hypothetical protein